MQVKSKILKLLKTNYKLIAVLLLVTFVISIVTYQKGFAYEVKVDGKSIGFVRKQAEVIEAQDTVNELIKKHYGETAFYEQELNHEKVRNKDVSTVEEIVDEIIPEIQVLKPAHVIYVDNSNAVALETKESAEKVLNDIKVEVKNEMTVEVEMSDLSFSQDVEIKEENISVNRIYPEDIAYLVLSPDANEVKEIDVTAVSTGTMTRGVNMFTEDTVDALSKKALDVEVSVEEVKTESIPFKKTTENNPSAYEDINSVKQKGENGSKEITLQVKYINGVKTSETVISEKVTKEATNQITLVGSKKRPAPVYNGSIGNAIVQEAYKYIGVKYTAGGTTPATGFDCTGFTRYVYGRLGYNNLGTSVSSQLNGGHARVSRANLKPGDIVLFPGHAGIYIGNGKMIHAPYAGRSVEVNDLKYFKFTTGIRPYA